MFLLKLAEIKQVLFFVFLLFHCMYYYRFNMTDKIGDASIAAEIIIFLFWN